MTSECINHCSCHKKHWLFQNDCGEMKSNEPRRQRSEWHIFQSVCRQGIQSYSLVSDGTGLKFKTRKLKIFLKMHLDPFFVMCVFFVVVVVVVVVVVLCVCVFLFFCCFLTECEPWNPAVAWNVPPMSGPYQGIKTSFQSAGLVSAEATLISSWVLADHRQGRG